MYTLAAMPMHKSDLATPALLLDLTQFASNIQTMQAAVSGAGKRLRPHAKAHKCVQIARRQIASGATGVCVATLSELELMSSAGIGVLLTTPVASALKTDRIAALAKNRADIRVVIDHHLQAELYQSSAERYRVRLDVLVDLDVGDHRTGIPCDERAIALAKLIRGLPNLRLIGLQAYSVSGSHTEGWAARQTHSTNALAPAIAIQTELIAQGMDVMTLTGGSTGTWDIDTRIAEVTEIQAGSYALMDVAYRRIGGVPFAPALTVLATVVSASHKDHVTVDAGFKALATDRPFGPEAINLQEDSQWQWAGDEHGIVRFEGAGEKFRPGDRIEFIPPHCDPTVNLYDRIHACIGEQVEEVWPLKRLAMEPVGLTH